MTHAQANPRGDVAGATAIQYLQEVDIIVRYDTWFPWTLCACVTVQVTACSEPRRIPAYGGQQFNTFNCHTRPCTADPITVSIALWTLFQDLLFIKSTSHDSWASIGASKTLKVAGRLDTPSHVLQWLVVYASRRKWRTSY
jgi:hypothetical protein